MGLEIIVMTKETLAGAVDAIRSLPEFFYERDFQKAEESYTRFVQGRSPDDIFLVALDNQEVVGVVGAVKRLDADGVYFLASFAVKKGQRGAGIGKAILEALENHLRARRARIVYSESSTASYCDPTRAFYEAVGYAMVAEVADFWADGDPLALYEKRL